MLDQAQLRDIFSQTRTVAVVGLLPNPERPSHEVAQALQARGLRIVPINPVVAAGGGAILGEAAWPDLPSAARALAAQGVSIDIVDVFRTPSAVPAIVEEAIAVGAPVLWLQRGVVHEEAAARAQRAGLVVEMDRCLMVEWMRLLG